jgi:hypothetical protein
MKGERFSGRAEAAILGRIMVEVLLAEEADSTVGGGVGLE